MRLVGVREAGVASGVVSIGVLSDDGRRVGPVAPVDEFYADVTAGLRRAGATIPDRAVDGVQLVPPVPASARVLCVGLNYRAHAAEGNFDPPPYPTIFGRWTASLSVGGVAVRVPTGEPGLDWEGEVAAVVGSPLRDAEPAEALAGVLGYSTFNDLTARTAQKLTSQWTLGKNADGSGPMGPLVTADEVGDLAEGLTLETRVNGEVVQHATTKDMLFTVGEVLALLSRTFTLNPGDVLATGTPEGVGYVRKPPRFLTAGDVVEVEVERLGVLTTPVGP